MAETQIPNSGDLFQIYEAQLKMMNDINNIIVKNKMDKKYFSRIQDSIIHSSKTLNILINELNQLSSAAFGASVNAKTMHGLVGTIEEYQNIMLAVQNIPLKLLMSGKIKMILIKKNLKNLLKFAVSLGDFNVVKIKLAQMNLKMMEPMMESMEILMTPLKKVSLKDLFLYGIAIRRYKRALKKLGKLITFIGNYKVIKFAMAKKNIEFIASILNTLPTIFQSLDNKLSIKQIFKYRRAIARIHTLLFGTVFDRIFRRSHSVIGLAQNIGEASTLKSIKATATMMMIKRMFQDINNTLAFIQEKMSWLEKNKIQTSIDRMWVILFGEDYGWIGRNVFRKKGRKNLGVFDLVAGFNESIYYVDALKAAVSAVELVVFIKALNIALSSLGIFTGVLGRMRKRLAKRGIQRLYDTLFGDWTSKQDVSKAGTDSILGLINGFSENEDTFKTGFKTIIGITSSIVEIYTNLQKISVIDSVKSILALWMMKYNFKVILNICDYLTSKETGALDKIKSAQPIISSLSDLLKSYVDIVKSVPSMGESLKVLVALGTMTLCLFAYIGILKLVNLISKKFKTQSRKSAQNQAAQLCKDMASMLKDFAEAIKLVPPANQMKDSLLSILIITTIMVAMIVIMQLTNRSGKESRKANRSARMMRVVFASILIVVLAIIAIGALLVIGLPVITIAIGFITALLAFMIIMALASKYLKQGAIALALMALTLLGLVAVMAIIVMLVENTSWKTWVGVVAVSLIMFFILAIMIAMTQVLAEIPQTDLTKGELALAGLVVIIGLAAGVMFLLGKVAEKTDGWDLLGLSQTMILVIGEMFGLTFLLSAMKEDDLIKGELAMTGLAAIMVLAGKAMTELGKAIEISGGDVGKLLAASQIMNLTIAELGLMACGAGLLMTGPQAIPFLAGVGAIGIIAAIAWAAANAMQALAEASMTLDKAGITGTASQIARTLAKKIMIPLQAIQLSPDGNGKLGRKGYEEGSVLDVLNKLDKKELRQAKKKMRLISKTIKFIGNICTVASIVTAMPPIDSKKLTDPVYAVVGKDGKGGVVGALGKIKRKDLRQTKRRAKTLKDVIVILRKIAKKASKLAKVKLPTNYQKQIETLGSMIEITVNTMSTKMDHDKIIKLYNNAFAYLKAVNLLIASTQAMLDLQAKANNVVLHTIEANGVETLTVTWMANRLLSDIADAGQVTKDQLSGIKFLLDLDYTKFLETCNNYENIRFIKDKEEINTPAGFAIGFIAKSIYQNVDGKNIKQRTSSWKQATDDSVKLIKSINTLDVTKTDSLRKLMHELYLFSNSIQGNFDKLADVINQKLIDTLNRLSDALNEAANAEIKVTQEPSVTPTNGAFVNPGDKNTNKNQQKLQSQIQATQNDVNDLKTIIRDLKNCIGAPTKEPPYVLHVKNH